MRYVPTVALPSCIFGSPPSRYVAAAATAAHEAMQESIRCRRYLVQSWGARRRFHQGGRGEAAAGYRALHAVVEVLGRVAAGEEEVGDRRRLRRSQVVNARLRPIDGLRDAHDRALHH